MLVCVDLWKALWFCSADGMTLDTKFRRIKLRGLNRGIVRVLRKRTMAGFAIDVGVLAGLLHLEDVRMAGFAGIVAGEVDGTGSNFSNGGSTVVAVLPEALRHHEVPDHKKQRESDYEQECEPEKMSCIFEKAHRINFPSMLIRRLN